MPWGTQSRRFDAIFQIAIQTPKPREHKDHVEDDRMFVFSMYCTRDVSGNEVFKAYNDQARTIPRIRVDDAR
jgi:hypothetical protein